jgi:hypothetical protein
LATLAIVSTVPLASALLVVAVPEVLPVLPEVELVSVAAAPAWHAAGIWSADPAAVLPELLLVPLSMVPAEIVLPLVVPPIVVSVGLVVAGALGTVWAAAGVEATRLSRATALVIERRDRRMVSVLQGLPL